MLVTHYMDETEQLADRLAVIHQGRVIATGTAQELIARSVAGIRVCFSSEHPDVSFLESIDGVRQVMRRGRQVEVLGSGPVLALVGGALVDRGIIPADLRVEQPTLEDAYMRLTDHRKEDRR